MAISFQINMKLTSPNVQEHWSKKHKRNKLLKLLVRSEWNKLKEKPSLPCKITITRIAPRAYDYDNYVASAKNLVDRISEMLLPNLAPGQADGDMRMQFEYRQERGQPKEYAVRITFEPNWPLPITM